MKNTILTEWEKNLICRAASDIESGNYLICPRSYSELAMVDEVLATINMPDNGRSDRQKEIHEYYKQYTNYDYWKNLPDDEKLF